MRAAIISFPGSNCEEDVARALHDVTGVAPLRLRHDETQAKKADLYVLPGGFSFGDYLRAGALAARATIMDDIVKRAGDGAYLLGICNGFQILLERGLLAGCLLTNHHLRFRCSMQALQVTNAATVFTHQFANDEVIHFPIAHQTGCYHADETTLNRLKDNDQIAFRYHDNNPNGSADAIAGIFDDHKRILGLMPHPERAMHSIHESQDGTRFFQGLLHALTQ